MVWAPDSPDLWAPDSATPNRWAPDSGGHLTLGRAVDLFLAMVGIGGIIAVTGAFSFILIAVKSVFLGEPVTAGMLPGCLLVLAATALVTGFNPFRAVPPEP